VYDNNGNLTSYQNTTYTWTVKNELESVTLGDGTVWSYTYDPFGTRLTATNETTGETTVYVSPTMEVRPDEAIYYVYAGGQRVASVSVPHSSGDTSDLSTLSLGDPAPTAHSPTTIRIIWGARNSPPTSTVWSARFMITIRMVPNSSTKT
jgi:YD repeat-containing protein